MTLDTVDIGEKPLDYPGYMPRVEQNCQKLLIPGCVTFCSGISLKDGLQRLEALSS